jgi:hypothetical protein
MWPAALPPSAPRFAARHIHVINVSYLANRGEAVFVNPPNLARRHLYQGITCLDVRQCRLLSGAARNLATTARTQFNIVNVSAKRNDS